MNTNDKEMGWLQSLKFWARLIAWAGALIFASDQVLETIHRTSSPSFIVCLWIFLVTLCVTGIIDIYEKAVKTFKKEATRSVEK